MKRAINIEEFCKYNLDDLRRMITYHTGIKDDDFLNDSVNDVVLSMIENKTIEKYDSDRGASFETYVYRCMYWSLSSKHRKQNLETVSIDNCAPDAVSELINESDEAIDRINDYKKFIEKQCKKNSELKLVYDYVDHLLRENKIGDFALAQSTITRAQKLHKKLLSKYKKDAR